VFNTHKHASRSKTLLAHSVLAQLREEARDESAMVDDDVPRVPSPLDSPQSRRAAAVEVTR
jgi:hypothetical protein